MDTADTPTAPVFAPRLPPAPRTPAPSALPPTLRGSTGSPLALPPSVFTVHAFTPPPPPPRGRAGWFARLIVALIVIGGLTAAGVVRYRTTPTGATGRPSAPTEWDPRIVDLVRFVERERGLVFDHPVATNFLPEDEFVQLFEAPESAGPAAEELDRQTGDMYSALGLASDYDPSAGQETIDQVSILGFYDPSEDAMYIRGDQLTPEVSIVLVHELTHALQAQHFAWRLGGPDDLQVRSVIEADAMRIEDRYADTMPIDEAATPDEATGATGMSSELDAVPWAMIESQYAPYVLGPSFLDVVEQLGGSAAVDAALTSPPTMTELLDPWAYVDHGAVRPSLTAHVATSPAGSEVIYRSSEFGLFDAMVMLDAWLPWQQTRRALDQWNGGAMEVYSVDGQVCTNIVIGVLDGVAAQRLADAVTAWAVASGSTAAPTIGTDPTGLLPTVTFSPCARPARAPVPSNPALSTSYELSFENMLVSQAVDSGSVDRRVARCAARLLIDDPAFNELMYVDELTPEQSERLYTSGDATRTWCQNDPTALPER